MTESEVYTYIKKKVLHGIIADQKVESQKIKELELINRAEEFLDNFQKENDHLFKKFTCISEGWLNMAYNDLSREKYYWKMKNEWAEQCGQRQWLLNFREGKHTTGPIRFEEMADECGCSIKEIKKYTSSLERDGLIGKMKNGGFFPYCWYLVG